MDGGRRAAGHGQRDRAGPPGSGRRRPPWGSRGRALPPRTPLADTRSASESRSGKQAPARTAPNTRLTPSRGPGAGGVSGAAAVRPAEGRQEHGWAVCPGPSHVVPCGSQSHARWTAPQGAPRSPLTVLVPTRQLRPPNPDAVPCRQRLGPAVTALPAPAQHRGLLDAHIPDRVPLIPQQPHKTATRHARHAYPAPRTQRSRRPRRPAAPATHSGPCTHGRPHLHANCSLASRLTMVPSGLVAKQR